MGQDLWTHLQHGTQRFFRTFFGPMLTMVGTAPNVKGTAILPGDQVLAAGLVSKHTARGSVSLSPYGFVIALSPEACARAGEFQTAQYTPDFKETQWLLA